MGSFRRSTIACAVLGFVVSGCVDPVATRKLNIVEVRGVDSGTWAALELDTSAVPSASVQRRERTDGVGQPISEVRLFANQPVKLLLVPATQPSAQRTAE